MAASAVSRGNSSIPKPFQWQLVVRECLKTAYRPSVSVCCPCLATVFHMLTSRRCGRTLSLQFRTSVVRALAQVLRAPNATDLLMAARPVTLQFSHDMEDEVGGAWLAAVKG